MVSTVQRMVSAIAASVVAAGVSASVAGDWPQILGPSRSGVAVDERLADRWPDDGPRIEWRRNVGSGYAGIAVADGRGFLFHREGDREVIEAIDAATGRTLWRDDHPTSFAPQVGGGDGPLCTPTVHEGRVVTFGAEGVLACHDAATGKRLWQRSTHREFDAAEGYFGAGSSPIVVGPHVIVNVGGTRNDAGIVAFSLVDGGAAWKATSEPASYSAPVQVDVDGEPHVLVVTRYRCLLVAAANGAVRWQFPFGMRGPTVNGATPVVFGGGREPRHLLVTASYGIGSVCATFDRAAATTVWAGVEMLASQYATPIVVDGRVYAIDGRDDLPPADLVCLDAATGRAMWRERGFGYGTLIFAGGTLLAAKTDGELVLIRPTPERCDVLSRARPLAGTLRALPALSDGRLYVRNERELVCIGVGP